jgi:hypothetical protein
MFGTFEDYLKKKRAQYGTFDDSALDRRFVAAYNDGQRIRVKFPWGDVKTGTVDVTTGWKPVFLLMRNSRSTGSSDILDGAVQFTKEKCGKGD